MLRRTSTVIHTSAVRQSSVTSEAVSMVVTCLEIQVVNQMYFIDLITGTGLSALFQKMMFHKDLMI